MNESLIKKWMEKEGLRKEELAVKLKVSLSTVNNILNGKKPYRPLVTVLANLMSVPEEKLISSFQSSKGKKFNTN